MTTMTTTVTVTATVLAAGPSGVDHGVIASWVGMPLEQWLVNPEGYTILAACGPHEKAWELKIEEGELKAGGGGLKAGGGERETLREDRRGALTYFLVQALSALRKRGVQLTNQSLYEYVRIQFHASWPQQTPMRYGNENLTFFGNLGIAPRAAFTPVQKESDGRLFLNAGEVHGVHRGDMYAVYPFDTPEDDTRYKSAESVMVKVKTVHCLTSNLVQVEETASATSAVERIITGWKAGPVTRLSPGKTCVRITARASPHLQLEEDVGQQGFLRLCTEDEDTEPCIFHVTLNELDEFEILDTSQKRIVSLPAIPLNTPGASDRVMGILHHVATFKFFEGVENRTPNISFESMFSFFDANGDEASLLVDIRHEETWKFRVVNRGD
ncbi:hypothetical protein B0T24DRAFT_671656 [Lasiosphaeria ovina]|uniref:Uncharacterized protein n=1 Tax=Lasiosphaeria ovina TaxID=92902 RepID=A0AAE0JSY7_9PEZI|nr:hypothetical protein B0T24DRAFT_671656 [Lasiosphaeria ovina]